MTPLLSNQLLRTQSDGRLTTLAAAGHDRAFEAIVDRYRKPLHRYLRRLLSEPLAEDVLQATFVRAWHALKSGSEVRDLRPWLYRIAHNQAVNALRAASVGIPEVSGVEAAASTETAVQQRDELRRALDGIGALPERQRAALVAIAVADRPHADVARELGLSDGALRQLLLRARMALRAAATAVTPYPVFGWLSAGSDATATRVAEVAVGAGGVGVAFKTGAAVLAAGAVVAGAPALHDARAPARAARTTSAQAAARATPIATTQFALQAGDDNRGHSGTSSGTSGHGDKGSGKGKSDDDRSGRGSGSSGHGSGDDDVGGSGSGSGKSGGDDDGRSGSGSKGSGSSGSGSKGSGSSGSGSKGSGSSGSGSSGSGSSGSGSSDSRGSDSGSSGSRGSGSESSGSGSSGSGGGGSADDELGGSEPKIQRSGSGSGDDDSGHGGDDDQLAPRRASESAER